MVHRLLGVAIGAYPSYPALFNVQNVQVSKLLFFIFLVAFFSFICFILIRRPGNYKPTIIQAHSLFLMQVKKTLS